MIFYSVIFLLFVGPLLWVTIRGKDAWPLSHYPMFSGLTKMEDVEVFRIALQGRDGDVVWWCSRFYRYPEFVGKKLKQLQQMANEGERAAKLASLERQRLLAEVLRLIEAEAGTVECYEAFQVMHRTARRDPEKGLVIHDATIATIPFQTIRLNRHGI